MIDHYDLVRILLFQNIQHLNIGFVIFGCFGYFLLSLDKTKLHRRWEDLKQGKFFKQKYSITIEGIRYSKPQIYTGRLQINTIYSNPFKAIASYLLKNIHMIDINTIRLVSENSPIDEDNTTLSDFHYIIQDENPILMNREKEIFMESTIDTKIMDTRKDSNISCTFEYIYFTIYSYKSSLFEIQKYIDSVTDEYLLSVNEYRKNKLFVYSLIEVSETSHKKDDDDVVPNIWKESVFQSSKRFDNIFFDEKEAILSKIDFFMKNKHWYFEYGIPYTLGFCLHGPPGTGKTSFIKALAQYTGRHIINISLKMIKTKGQLEKLFFEDTYVDMNQEGSVGFDKKIIVFEDIDCIGDIVLDRELQKKSVEPQDALITTLKLLQNDTTKQPELLPNKITLDDILNLWDGIRETTGRIMVITSNHYDKLDPALIRPGRIDFTLNMKNASHKTICDMYRHLYKTEIPEHIVSNILTDFYSPAELINLYVKHYTESDKYLARLLENKKI